MVRGKACERSAGGATRQKRRTCGVHTTSGEESVLRWVGLAALAPLRGGVGAHDREDRAGDVRASPMRGVRIRLVMRVSCDEKQVKRVEAPATLRVPCS